MFFCMYIRGRISCWIKEMKVFFKTCIVMFHDVLIDLLSFVNFNMQCRPNTSTIDHCRLSKVGIGSFCNIGSPLSISKPSTFRHKKNRIQSSETTSLKNEQHILNLLLTTQCFELHPDFTNPSLLKGNVNVSRILCTPLGGRLHRNPIINR